MRTEGVALLEILLAIACTGYNIQTNQIVWACHHLNLKPIKPLTVMNKSKYCTQNIYLQIKIILNGKLMIIENTYSKCWRSCA